jgi:rubrerythrin
MTMIETAAGAIIWECSACQATTTDRKNIERKMKTCPHCGAEIQTFVSLFDDDGEYLE